MASNSHYGRPQNLLSTGPSVNMGDGWETARNPNRPPEFKLAADGMMELPGNDWHGALRICRPPPAPPVPAASRSQPPPAVS